MGIRSICAVVAAGLIVTVADSAFAKRPSGETNLATALEKAKTENKLLFVQYGRETCGNCQALKSMVKGRQLKLSESDFIYADVSCDDPATRKLFATKFKVEGRTLPFVVIADPTGNQLAARAGSGELAQYTEFVRDTKRAYDKEHKPSGKSHSASLKASSSAAGIPFDASREMRSWTLAGGVKMTAALVEERANKVFLKKENGTTNQVSSTALSKADQAYLSGLREAAAKTAGQ